MAFQFVTVRARTRGKSPQEFTYQGIGKLKPRKVMDKDQNPVAVDGSGKPVKVTYNETTKEYEIPAGSRFVEVDDLDVDGLAGDDSLPEVLALYNGNMSALLTASLIGLNVKARSDASPVTEQLTEDELTPIVTGMLAAGIMDEKAAGVWRRTVTMAANQLELERLAYVKMTPHYKKLIATGWKAA